ncbi:MAG: LytR family transcriptional regulator [Ruminococcaceae bacterium]|nr:LytR family transcriptional regulator [Oscillospiraceae bacterium]
MKLFGGSSKSHHVANSRRSSANHAAQASGALRWLRTILIVFVAIVLMIGAITMAIRSISKPPERPNIQDDVTMNEPDVPTIPDEKEEPPVEDETPPEEQPPVPEEQPPAEEEEIEVMLPSEEPKSYTEGIYNILICGTDEDGFKSDTIIIANLNANDHTVSLLSVPRDTLIYCDYPIPKINAAYTAGGVRNLKKHLATLLGFQVDGYVVVDLEAFVQIVDLVGGVEFDVPQDMFYNDPSQDLYINLQKGYQLLDGEHAMQLVRYRKYDAADLKRISVQQDFLKALAKKCVSIGSLTKIREYAEIVQTYVETDLSLGNIIWFGEELLKCDFDQMKAYTPGGDPTWVNGASCYALWPNALLRTLNESFNPYDRDLTIGDISVRPAPEPEPEEEEPADAPEGEQPGEGDVPSDDPVSAPDDGYILPGSSGANPGDWVIPGNESEETNDENTSSDTDNGGFPFVP